jgi:hypothetical protein
MFQKGISGNPGGRPKGSENKATKEIRERLKDFCSNNWDRFERDFKKLSPLERAQIFEKLLKFVVPTMKEADVTLSLEKLTDSQLDQLMERIMNNNEPRP